MFYKFIANPLKLSEHQFNKMFQKHFGMTPKKYQMEYYGSINKRINKTARQQG
jgi:methylphosphotriester-DNA--protein-cysteine methyltransferase